MTNADMIDCSLIAVGVIAATVLVVGAIRSKVGTRMRWSIMIAGITLSVLAGYSWVLLSGVLGFLALRGSISGGSDWSGESDTWLSGLVFQQAVPCGIAIGVLGAFLTVRWFFRKPSLRTGDK